MASCGFLFFQWLFVLFKGLIILPVYSFAHSFIYETVPFSSVFYMVGIVSVVMEASDYVIW